MYIEHFGLRALPFGITPDTSFFFACSNYQAALNTLLIAAKSGEGFIKITGEVGTGKTMLCRKFMSSLDDSFVMAYIPNPSLEPRTLMLALADELEISLAEDVNQHRLMQAINLRLMKLARLGKKVVLCLDEAQALPLESLEALRLLTNLETEKRKLLQIVLFGQPELNQKLQNNAIRQLTQRITFQYEIAPLTRDDMAFYIDHRLRVAGFAGSTLFTPRALSRLYRASKGIPRLVNILAHKSLMATYGEGSQQASAANVHLAIKDTFLAKSHPWRWRLLFSSPFFIAVIGFALDYFK
ncbi:ExeA family protein [Glaciimonas immobilis]|uniref:MSHA biogenesis protein MshM n=1 Tax=Glaciimonas immobilis TaxID=728004 RepID=A0A840RL84_9BURK|nr:AAA family ATPase [Glaciimonas immobilis]KAF3998988.1 AAA family ATPase [Glaciimonas immobilis]MBB5198405.1 MSHA biogenesis protein MshM [Glaciimonas immobilis]